MKVEGETYQTLRRQLSPPRFELVGTLRRRAQNRVSSSRYNRKLRALAARVPLLEHELQQKMMQMQHDRQEQERSHTEALRAKDQLIEEMQLVIPAQARMISDLTDTNSVLRSQLRDEDPSESPFSSQ